MILKTDKPDVFNSDFMIDNSILPSISIVVPNYNGGSTIEETLKSLITQDYPKLEIIVVDGGSTDNSVEIIGRYSSHISWWVSEKDNGQSHAINKGFQKCSGEILNWLCSDDILKPNALMKVGVYFSHNPDVDVFVGASRLIYTCESNKIWIKKPTYRSLEYIHIKNDIPQPSCFYRRNLLARREKYVDESYNYAMDFELWNYFKSLGAKWAFTDVELSIAFQDGLNKTNTGGEKITYEIESVYRTYSSEPIPLTFWHRRLRFPLEKFLAHHPNIVWRLLLVPIWVSITLILSPFYGFQRTWIMRWKRWA